MSELSDLALLDRLHSKARKAKFARQLRQVQNALRAHLSSSKRIQAEFMSLFQTQVCLRQSDFAYLDIGSRIRVACFVFHNFVDKLLVLRLFGDVLADVRLVQEPDWAQSK